MDTGKKVIDKMQETLDNPNKELTMKDINNLATVINADIVRSDIEQRKSELSLAKNDLLSTVIDQDTDGSFIEENLKRFTTVESLEKYLSESKDHILEMYTNPVTNETIDINVINDQGEMNFRKDLLLYLKESEIQMANIDAEYEKMDIATQEFQTNVGDACYQLADNILIYINGLKQKMELVTDTNQRLKMEKSIRGLESGFTMELFKTTYLKHPSAINRCKDEIANDSKITEIGKRYFAKLKTGDTKVNLIAYVSDDDRKKSFEEMVFAPDEYNTKPDMFVFSLIRFFSMANWNDVSIIQAHATIALNIKKLIANDIDEEVKMKVKEAILDYLKIFE